MSQRDLEMALYAAIREAEKRNHEFVMVEHLLLALSYDRHSARVLRACGVEIGTLRDDLTYYLDDLEAAPGAHKQPVQSVAFQRVLQRAVMQARAADKRDIQGYNVIIAMFDEDDSFAVYILERHGATKMRMMRTASHGPAEDDFGDHKDDDEDEDADEETLGDADEEEDEDEEGMGEHQRDPLQAYMSNLNVRAREGHIDPLIGRIDEVQRLWQTLCRRRKNNPLLVGDSGVGKTAIVEGLAWLMEQGRAPEALAGYQIYALDLGSMLAGTKFRGQFEQRLKRSLKALHKVGNAILFIDEIHTVVGAGATTGGTMDASNLLKPALASGELRCIGATTHDDYRRVFYRDPAFRRRFQKVDINEPTLEDTIGILRGLREKYESFHGVTFTEDALVAAATLAARYIQERKLPDKAIDVIDEVGARNRVLPASDRQTLMDTNAVEAVVAKLGRMPEITAGSDERSKLAGLHDAIARNVFGQEQAIEAVVTAVKLNRAGLGVPDKPVGAFLFAGPTGVGKTEVAKQLANALAVDFIRFDMSEYQEQHAVSRLIGAPPGYVGFDNGGLLTEAVRKSPHAVLLLDEIEKAHPNLYDILLQVMDAATLTDNNGRVADFRNIVLIMTSNAGGREMGQNVIGFGAKLDVSRSLKAVERAFSPEFRNRLDRVVIFNPLAPDIMTRIAQKFIRELAQRLSERQVEIEVTPAVIAWLARVGYEEAFGARPMGRVIHQHIKLHLADAMLFGELEHGGTVHVDKTDEESDRLSFQFTAAPTPPTPPAKLAPKADTSHASPATPRDDDGGIHE